MLRAPIWITSVTSRDLLHVARVEELGHDRQTRLLAGFGEDLEAFSQGPGTRTATSAA